MSPRALGVALAAVPLFASASASADGGARFWVEGATPACADAAHALARDLVLACDAAGRACSVAGAREDATRFVVLRCDEATAWTLVGYDVLGERWSVALGGPEAERPRTGALFALRFEATDAPAVTPERAAAPPSPPPPPAPPLAPSPPVEHEAPTTAKVLTYGGFGVALAAGIAAVATGLASRAKSDDVKTMCVGGATSICPRPAQPEIDEARTLGNWSTALFLTAGAGLVTGVVGVVLWTGSGSTSGSVRATAGVGSLGLSGAF